MASHKVIVHLKPAKKNVKRSSVLPFKAKHLQEIIKQTLANHKTTTKNNRKRTA